MGLFGSLFGLAADIVTLPLSVASDVVKVASGEGKPTSTSEHLDEIVEDVKEVVENV